MDLEDITLSEISQTHEDKYCIISFVYEILNSKLRQTIEWWSLVVRGRRNGKMLIKRHKVSVM